MCNYFPHRKENLTFVRKNNRQIQHDETVFTLFLFVADSNFFIWLPQGGTRRDI